MLSFILAACIFHVINLQHITRNLQLVTCNL